MRRCLRPQLCEGGAHLRASMSEEEGSAEMKRRAAALELRTRRQKESPVNSCLKYAAPDRR